MICLCPSHAHTIFTEIIHYKGEAWIPSGLAQNSFHFLDQRYGSCTQLNLTITIFFLSKIYLQHVGFIQIYTVNTRKLTAQEWRHSFECFFDQINANKLADTHTVVHIKMCVGLPACSHWFDKFFQERLHLLIASQWQSWRQLGRCYYCRGCKKIFFLSKWVILSQL